MAPMSATSEQVTRTAEPDASMRLLREAMSQPLDPAYEMAARLRRIGESGPRRYAGVVTVILALVCGWVVARGIGELRRPQPGQAAGRATLEREINRRTAHADAQQRAIERLRSEIAAAQRAQLTSPADIDLARRAQQLCLATGETAVTGPGLQITLSDAPAADPGTSVDPRAVISPEDGRVLDRDLQIVVNGLWVAGAEAISVNGRRLTVLSAIRSAGQAILVDFRPLIPPYVVAAIGDPARLRNRFAANHAGSYLQSIRDSYGVRRRRRERKPTPATRSGDAGIAPSGPGDGQHVAADYPPDGGDPVIAALGLVIGVVAGILLHPTVPIWLQPYLPIAVVAALDAVFGGVRAMLDGIFDDRVFVVSFLSNIVVAALIVYLGDQLGVGSQLSTGVVVVLGIRIFSNAAAIRRHLFKA